MKIMQCSNCNRYIFNSDKCIHCNIDAKKEEIIELKVNGNATDRLKYIEVMIEGKKFKNAIDEIEKVVEWLPEVSYIFWLKVLAKNKCSNVREVIGKGVELGDDPDFYKALKLSKDVEHEIYLDIQKTLLSLKNMFRESIVEQLNREKRETGIVEETNRFDQMLKDCTKELLNEWTKFDDIETRINLLYKNIQLSLNEHLSALKDCEKKSEKLYNKLPNINRLKNGSFDSDKFDLMRISEETIYSCEIEAGCLTSFFEMEKNEIEGYIENHPWISEIRELEVLRDEKKEDIEAYIREIKNCKSRMGKIISQVHEIEDKYNAVLSSLDRYSFKAAIDILGEDSIDKIYKKCGVYI